MNYRPIFTISAWIAFVTSAPCQTAPITPLIMRAQERSPLVRAAQLTVVSQRAALDSARSAVSPSLELSPGLGFTNGNAVLSQEFDFFGRRGAETRLAAVELRLAELELAKSKASVTLDLLSALALVLSGQEEVEVARSGFEAAKALQVAVAKQHDIGEAPKVHVTRVEIDVLRAAQVVAAAEAKLRSARAAMQSLLGDQPDLHGVTWPTVQEGVSEPGSFQLLEAEILLDRAKASARLTRNEFAPTVSAGVTTDAWSLDRRVDSRDRLGIQLSIRMPLFDLGQRRGAIKAKDFEGQAAQAKVEEARRIATLKLEEAAVTFDAAKFAAATFDSEVLPRGESMLTAMRQGYSSGLITLVEVLEAQRTVAQLRLDRTQALLNLRLAELDLWNARLTLPGTEVPR